MAVKCANCEIEIRWPPVVTHGEVYCCEGCAEGGPCTCDYEQLRASREATPAPIRFVRFEICTTV